jgi:hypothetical protein
MVFFTHTRKRGSPHPNPLILFDYARHTPESLVAGIHQVLFIGNWPLFLAQLIPFVAACVFAAEAVSTLAAFQEVCCYPLQEANQQELRQCGTCTDRRSLISRHTGGLSADGCGTRPTLYTIWSCLCAGCFLGSVVIWALSYKLFRKTIDGHIKYYTLKIGIALFKQEEAEDAAEHAGLSLLVILRRVFHVYWFLTLVLALHLRAVGMKRLCYFHIVMFIICAANGFTLFSYALQEGKAWACYPTYGDLRAESLGMCTDPNSTAYQMWSEAPSPPPPTPRVTTATTALFGISALYLALEYIIIRWGLPWRGKWLVDPYEVRFIDLLHKYAMSLDGIAADVVSAAGGTS